MPKPHHRAFTQRRRVEGEGGLLSFRRRHCADNKKTDVIRWLQGQQRPDLPADNAPDAGALPDGRRVINRDSFQGMYSIHDKSRVDCRQNSKKGQHQSQRVWQNYS